MTRRSLLLGSLAIVAAFLWFAEDMAAQEEGPTISRKSGGSIRTRLSDRIILNPNSSLEREWITMHDPKLPVDLTGTVGMSTKYVEVQGSRAAATVTTPASCLRRGKR